MEWIQLAEVGSSGRHLEVGSQPPGYETAGEFTGIMEKRSILLHKHCPMGFVMTWWFPVENQNTVTLTAGKRHALNSSVNVR